MLFDFLQVLKEKNEYYDEMRRMEYELTSSLEERDKLQTNINEIKAEHKKELVRINAKLKSKRD